MIAMFAVAMVTTTTEEVAMLCIVVSFLDEISYLFRRLGNCGLCD